MDKLEEGQNCLNKECKGVYMYVPDGICCCHINPPCNACVDSILVCNSCDVSEDDIEEGK